MNAFAQPLTRFSFHPLGVIGDVELNYHELACLDMALSYLRSQVTNDQKPYALLGVSHHEIDCLDNWLHLVEYRQQLRLDGSNTVHWPFTSFRDVEWLLLGLRYGINEDLIITTAADHANYEYDMETILSEDNLDAYTLADLAYHDSYQSFYHYYAQIAAHKAALITKLKAILDSI